MKTITYSVVLTLSCYLLAAQEIVTSKTKTTAEAVYEKAVADNTKEAERAYQAYVKALDEANAKVLKALESAKADLNDTKKFTKLTITERATAIAEIEEKIKAVKAGAVGEAIVDRRGDLPKGKVDLGKLIVGEWVMKGNNKIMSFKDDGNVTFHTNVGTWWINNNKIYVTWDNNSNDEIIMENNTIYRADKKWLCIKK